MKSTISKGLGFSWVVSMSEHVVKVLDQEPTVTCRGEHWYISQKRGEDSQGTQAPSWSRSYWLVRDGQDVYEDSAFERMRLRHW